AARPTVPNPHVTIKDATGYDTIRENMLTARAGEVSPVPDRPRARHDRGTGPHPAADMTVIDAATDD
ncbi:MAG: hypothetical protein ABEK12_01175, partial [Candidatus Nanohaloarchaea archaeon]